MLTFFCRSFFISGRARVTIFAAEGNARTFDYMAGDVGVVPRNMGVSRPSLISCDMQDANISSSALYREPFGRRTIGGLGALPCGYVFTFLSTLNDYRHE